MSSRSMRSYLASVAQQLTITTEPEYDRRNGWEWEWIDGPTIAAMEETLGDAASRVRLRRRSSPRACAVAVVVEALTDTDAYTWLERADVTDAPDARSEALAEALLSTAPDYGADDHVWLRRHLASVGGPAGLLHPYPGSEGDPLAMSALEHLTATYGTTDDRDSWRRHLTVPHSNATDLARAALEDPEVDRSSCLAAVGMLGVLRAELERMELTAMDRAISSGLSYTDLGGALGISRQKANKRHHRRANGNPTRLSP